MTVTRSFWAETYLVRERGKGEKGGEGEEKGGRRGEEDGREGELITKQELTEVR